jgi:hypothetical protein
MVRVHDIRIETETQSRGSLHPVCWVSSLIPYQSPSRIVKTNNTTVSNELTISIEASLNHRHTMNNINKTQAAMLAAVKRPVPAGDIHVYRNQNGDYENSKCHLKSAATLVQAKEDAKRDKDEKSRCCRETKDEEQRRDAYADGNLNEARSLRLLALRIHNSVLITPNRSTHRPPPEAGRWQRIQRPKHPAH